jgi:hypothetical protein
MNDAPPAAPDPIHEIDDEIGRAIGLMNVEHDDDDYRLRCESRALARAVISIALSQRERLAIQKANIEKIGELVDRLRGYLDRVAPPSPEGT